MSKMEIIGLLLIAPAMMTAGAIAWATPGEAWMSAYLLVLFIALLCVGLKVRKR